MQPRSARRRRARRHDPDRLRTGSRDTPGTPAALVRPTEGWGARGANRRHDHRWKGDQPRGARGYAGRFGAAAELDAFLRELDAVLRDLDAFLGDLDDFLRDVDASLRDVWHLTPGQLKANDDALTGKSDHPSNRPSST